MSTTATSSQHGLHRRLRRQPTISSPEPCCSSTSVRNSVVAGYLSGIGGTLIGHPMDSAKVWLQNNHSPSITSNTSSTASPSSTSSTTSTNHAWTSSTTTKGTTASLSKRGLTTLSSLVAVPSSTLRSTVAHYARTLRALYQGISGPLVTVGLVQSVHFGIYDSVRRILYYNLECNKNGIPVSQQDYLYNDSLRNVMLASMMAGSVLAVFTSPMLILKTQQQLRDVSVTQGMRDMVAHGVRGMWVGFGPHLVCEVANRGIYFVTYEYLKRSLAQRRRQQQTPTLPNNSITNTLQERMFSAGLAGVVCWSIVFPLDAVRCRLFAQTGPHKLGALAMARHMYAKGHWRAFYRGFAVTVLRAGPVAAVILPLYDLTLERLNAMS